MRSSDFPANLLPGGTWYRANRYSTGLPRRSGLSRTWKNTLLTILGMRGRFLTLVERSRELLTTGPQANFPRTGIVRRHLASAALHLPGQNSCDPIPFVPTTLPAQPVRIPDVDPTPRERRQPGAKALLEEFWAVADHTGYTFWPQNSF